VSGSYQILNPDGSLNLKGRFSKLRGHGNDSWEADKKSYNLTLDREADLLGLGAARKYVLLAGYRDNSLLTYKLTYDLAREVGMAYAPKSQLVQLYVDGEYLGLYLLVGKIEVGENRFALNEQAGGCILELDMIDHDFEKSHFVSDRNLIFMLKSMPDASEEQVERVRSIWQGFEDALFGEGGYNEEGDYYASYIDMESFADQWIFYELNEEKSLSSSIYFYLNASEGEDTKLYAAWPWDVEHSLTSLSRAGESLLPTTEAQAGIYWRQLYSHEDFREMVYQEWIDKFVPALEKALQEGSIENPDGISSLDWYLETYRADFAKNQKLWEDCDFEAKLEKIRSIYEIRKDYLTEALADPQIEP
jgi:hypothetical protein